MDPRLSPPPAPSPFRAGIVVFVVIGLVGFAATVVLVCVCCLCKVCCACFEACAEAAADAGPQPRSQPPRSREHEAQISGPAAATRPQPRPRSRDDGGQFPGPAAHAGPQPLPRPPRARDDRAQLARASGEARPTATDRLSAYEYIRPVNSDVTAGGGEEARACSVCLGEFQPGEMVRLLPVCLHLYHVQCIDPWLDARSTCPICRSNTDPNIDVGALPPV